MSDNNGENVTENTNENPSSSIDTVMHETRLFPPKDSFLEGCEIGSLEAYEALYDRAKADPIAFWEDLARNELHWFEDFHTTLNWNVPNAEWFVGGKTNVSYNCLDRNLENNADKTAIIWEGEPGDVRTFTYRELHSEVSRLANAFKKAGVQQGDVVSIYMPMVPELAFAMLACARIGAVHSVIFAGFSAESIADRNNDANAKVQLTADGAYRRGKVLELKTIVDEALEKSPTVETCIVLARTDTPVEMQEGRDLWWNDLLEQVDDDCPATPLDSEAPLFILYTSGSTGKPKGIKHTTAGYNLYAKKSFEWVFDIRDDDIFWCTADCGWITGHTYVAYGPLCAGATIMMFEGAPNYPEEDRFWELVEKH
ncbi:MAG: AMP-binding protein, partial [Planctomycetaceae bacterium]|nr:AMP-binding protein [Planctomycetaceae bacterium]